MQLAQNAVHGAMAGYTAFSSGVINNRTVSELHIKQEPLGTFTRKSFAHTLEFSTNFPPEGVHSHPGAGG